MTTNTVLNTASAYITMKGITLDRGTGTESAGAVFINKQCGVITTSSLTTTPSNAYTITFRNSVITSSSVLLLSWMGGTNSQSEFNLDGAAGSGTATITIKNPNNSGTNFNGTFLIGFAVF